MEGMLVRKEGMDIIMDIVIGIGRGHGHRLGGKGGTREREGGKFRVSADKKFCLKSVY